MSSLLIICDIDLTIADARHRFEKAGKMPSKKSRKVYQRWLDRLQTDESLFADPVIEATKKLLRSMSRESEIVYLTGRDGKFRAVTKDWLNVNEFPDGVLLMRAGDDYRSARDFKEQQVKNIKGYYHGSIILALDDDKDGDCSAMYLKHGITHLKVII